MEIYAKPNGPFTFMMSWGKSVGIKWNIYMETPRFRVFMLLHYTKTHVFMYFLPIFLLQNDVMVNGPFMERVTMHACNFS